MGFFGGGGGAAPANMVGATSSTAGTAGLVPAPAAGDQNNSILGDATFNYNLFVPRHKPMDSRTVAVWGAEASGSTSNLSAKIRYFSPFYIPVDGTLNRVSTFVGGAAAGVNAHFALWKYDQSNGSVGDLIYDIGTISLDTVNNVHKDFSVNQSVKRGILWASFTSDGTTNATRRISVQGNLWLAGSTPANQGYVNYAWSCDLGVGGTYNQITNTTLSQTGTIVFMHLRYA
jgi:hypothetical protein